MDKLTAEQAEHLIGLLNDSFQGSYFITGDATKSELAFILSQAVDKARNIINQCTEIEFPAIHMRPLHADDKEELKVYLYETCPQYPECIVVYCNNGNTHLNREQFREFVEGCNKIVDWLNNEEVKNG